MENTVIKSDLTLISESVIGFTIDDLFIQSFIGEGSTSKVYKAEQKPLNRNGAFKYLKEFSLESLLFKHYARMQQEADAMVKLEHENILPIYAAGTFNERAYIFMKYCELSFRNLLGTIPNKKSEIITWTQRFLQGTKGINFMHKKGYIHRDLNPEHFRIEFSDAYDLGFKVLMSDLGIVKRLDKISTEGLKKDTKFTAWDQLIGTPSYRSPEQTSLGTKITEKTDVFSLATSIQEILTGIKPFTSEDEYELAKKIQEEDPIRASKLNKQIPSDIDYILHKMFEKNPRDRPEMKEVITAFNDVILNKPNTKYFVFNTLNHLRTHTPKYVFALMSLGFIGDVAIDKKAQDFEVRAQNLNQIAAQLQAKFEFPDLIKSTDLEYLFNSVNEYKIRPFIFESCLRGGELKNSANGQIAQIKTGNIIPFKIGNTSQDCEWVSSTSYFSRFVYDYLINEFDERKQETSTILGELIDESIKKEDYNFLKGARISPFTNLIDLNVYDKKVLENKIDEVAKHYINLFYESGANAIPFVGNEKIRKQLHYGQEIIFNQATPLMLFDILYTQEKGFDVIDKTIDTHIKHGLTKEGKSLRFSYFSEDKIFKQTLDDSADYQIASQTTFIAGLVKTYNIFLKEYQKNNNTQILLKANTILDKAKLATEYFLKNHTETNLLVYESLVINSLFELAIADNNPKYYQIAKNKIINLSSKELLDIDVHRNNLFFQDSDNSTHLETIVNYQNAIKNMKKYEKIKKKF